eukprot:TRINITY_DN31072_c0_g1_i1.p1 TRINITY_DN31072_c0_g1~~TRINITY_DN31072_c0_g1_i1.p1  ORF type:complete len:421 (-),score=50.41 TRINITY_DN31072_c0_g1_i1:571-1833(-)
MCMPVSTMERVSASVSLFYLPCLRTRTPIGTCYLTAPTKCYPFPFQTLNCSSKHSLVACHIHQNTFSIETSFVCISDGKRNSSLRCGLLNSVTRRTRPKMAVRAENEDAKANESKSESVPNEEDEFFQTAAVTDPKEAATFINFTPKTSSKPPKKAKALGRFLREKGSEYYVDFDVDKGLEYLKDIHESDDESDDFEAKGQPVSGADARDPAWERLVTVDYKINEDEFHKLSLLHCDFFIKKVPDPDGDLYDFTEMYVSPPDTDVYSLPRIASQMPKEVTRFQRSNFEVIHVSEPIIQYPTDPMNKTEREVMKVFLIKHYQNKRDEDENFMLDFEEIYVIDSKSKEISRAKVVVTVPRENRDRRNEILTIHDGGTSFKIIPAEEREDPDTILNTIHYEKSRERLVNYLRGFRDFSESCWF